MADTLDRGDGRRRQVSAVMPHVLLRYVERALGPGAPERVLVDAGVPITRQQLAEPAGWLPAGDVNAIADAAARVCADPAVGRGAGAQMFLDSCETGMADFLVAAGSPAAAIAAAVAYGNRMSTERLLEVAGQDDDHLVIRARYRRAGPTGRYHRFYCDFIAGYYLSAPALFGLLGTVVEECCQVEGADECRFVVRWSADPRPRRVDVDSSTRRRERTLARFEELQAMATELLAATDVHEVLDRITQRAGVAVRAHRYLLAARTGDGEPVRVHHFGFRAGEEAEDLAARLLDADADADADADGAAEAGGAEVEEGVVVAQVASARRAYGVLAAVLPGGAAGEVDRRLLDAYARHAAAALEVVASLARARRDRDTAAALLDLARALAMVGTDEEIAVRLADAVPRVTGADLATVWRWDAAASLLRLGASHRPDGAPVHLPPAIDANHLPFVADLVATARPVLLHGATAPAEIAPLFAMVGVDSVAVVPIMGRAGVAGLVTAGFARAVAEGTDDPDGRAAELMDRLEGVAHHAAIAFDNAALLDQARHQAAHDSLTGLPNRRHAGETGEGAVQRAMAGGTGVGVLFMDIDRFKLVNDTLGHAAGDELIRAVAQRLRRVLRPGDVLSRLGGDEFTALLPGVAGPEEAVAVAERLVAAVRDPFVVAAEELFVTVSIGVACAPAHGTTYERLTSRADAAMYEAKRRGRNTVALCEGPAADDQPAATVPSEDGGVEAPIEPVATAMVPPPAAASH